MVSLPHRSTHISIHKSNGKPESSVTPGLDRVRKEAKRGSHKTLHVVILFVLDHKTGTRSLGQCSTRQPTVYSYTASHRSPLFRVDSPTRLHQHHCVHSISTHNHNILMVSLRSKSSNSCRGHMLINQLLDLLGLWFA